MQNESTYLRSQLKGYLFEIIILKLLRKNAFRVVDADFEPRERVRETRRGFIEFKGRGCWHQIDCPCDYTKLMPFTYPLRILGEVKFHKLPLEKKYIREYIGVIKDIQENYFASDSSDIRAYPRKMEIGVYFAANGFQAEAEKLAYAHGIKTISYKNNFLVDKLKKQLEELERNYLSVMIMQDEEAWSYFRDDMYTLLSERRSFHLSKYQQYTANGYMEMIERIMQSFMEIKTSFLATSKNGVFFHFVGNSEFPEELFHEDDQGRCRVFYKTDDFGNRYFWLEITGDDLGRRFYFTPPESLEIAAVFGREKILHEKAGLFQQLSVQIPLKGIARTLTLCLDQTWFDDIRNEQ